MTAAQHLVGKRQLGAVVLSASVKPHTPGECPVIKVELDPSKLQREPGENTDEAGRRYDYDLVRSLGKVTGIKVHHYTGVDGPHFDAARTGNAIIEIGLSRWSPEGKLDEAAADAVAQTLAATLNKKVQQRAAATAKTGRQS
jgi:hypothetical protein